MVAKKNYSRYFIILQEDERGHSIDSNKFPTGYSKIERRNTKCKISYYIQNLKKDNDPYYMLLICERKDEKRLVKLGTINIDDYGRADVSYEYDIDNIANCNIPMDNIKGASIIKLKGSSVHGILTGFVSGAKLDDWKSYAMIENKERCEKIEEHEAADFNVYEENQLEAEENQNTEHNIFAEYEENIENIKNSNKVRIDNYEDNDIKEEDIREEEDIEEFDEDQNRSIINEEETENIEDEEEIENQDTIEKLEDYRKCECKKEEKKKEKKNDCKKDKKEKTKEDKKEKKKEISKEDKKSKDVIHKFLCSIFKGLKEVKGVCPEIKNCKWYIVNEEDLMNMNPCIDFDKYTMLYYPMVSYYPYVKNYGHYLIGCKFDGEDREQFLVYAIPGTKSLLEQPFGGETGFVTWIRRNYNEDNDVAVGYWTMFYDFRNRKIVYPVKK